MTEQKKLASQAGVLMRRWITESGDADVTNYGGNFLAYFERNLWNIQLMMKLGRIRNARVLDIGCGFGWEAVAIAVLGNNNVTANDIRPQMADFIDRRLADFRREGIELPIHTLLGDICSLRLPPESFDAIYCNQTVEHVHTLEQMFEQAHRVLVAGGRMVIANDNNALTVKDLGEIEAMWEKRDRSWDYIAELKRERPTENANAEPYAHMRERILRQSNPRLNDEQIRRLAAATAGMVESEIVKLGQNYTDSAVLPNPPRYSWCRNPVTGEYCERQLDPFELRDLLAKIGFRCRIRHVFRRLPMRFLNAVASQALQRKIFEHRAPFVLVATK